MKRKYLYPVVATGSSCCCCFSFSNQLERSNTFPWGDLGVRKGFAQVFKIKNGKGKNGSLCQKKDLDRACQLSEPYHPYRSLLTYYMWRAADVKDVYVKDEDNDTTSTTTVLDSTNSNYADKPTSNKDRTVESTASNSTTPKKSTSSRKRKLRTVTP